MCHIYDEITVLEVLQGLVSKNSLFKGTGLSAINYSEIRENQFHWVAFLPKRP